MTTEKMTIHRALAELKLIDDRTDKAIRQGTFCIANKHSNEKIKGITIDDAKKIMQGDWDKSNDLINRRNAMKRAVVLSNAKTTVTIDGIEYTVAEAIEMKNHGLDKKELMLAVLQQQYQIAQAEILKHNGDVLDKRAEDYVTGIYGSKEGKTNTEDIERVKQDFIKSNTYELIDPLGILEKIEKLEKEIANFKADVDATLSVSNAVTEVEFGY